MKPPLSSRRSPLLVLLSLFLPLTLAAGACGSGSGTADGGPPDDSASAADRAAVMGAAVGHLIQFDNTFGGPPPFTAYLLLEDTDPTELSAGRPLTEAERSVIESTVAQYGPVEWIADAADHQTTDLRPTPDGAVIIGVTDPVFEDPENALVPVSLWCGGLCGTWITYRAELVDGTWVITGTEGPIAVS